MAEKEEKKEYITIGAFFSEYMDNHNARIVPFVPTQINAANHKTKKQAWCKVILPYEICDEDVRNLNKWALMIVAIPKTDIKE